MKAIRAVPPTLLAAWGAGVSLWYGRIGFHPLDHSIVFDGAWRLLCGQVPFRDFDTPFALVPMLMQVPFFAALGVNWFAFCLHAALINGAFTVAVYGFLRTVGARAPASSACAAAAALTLYPPAGAPCHDQHAYFFCFVAIALAARAASAGTPRAAAWRGALASVMLLAAYFSKQNPTVFAIPVFAGVLLLAAPGVRRPAWTGALLGGVAALGLLTAVALAAGCDLTRFHADYHVNPTREAARRAAGDERPAHFLGALATIVRGLGLLTLPIVPVAALATLALSGRARRSQEHRLALGLAAALPLVGLVATHLTFNDKEESLAFLFPSLGLLDVGLAGIGAAGAGGHVLSGMRVLLMAAALRDAVHFNAHVNVTRATIGRSLGLAEGADRLPASLSFMVWRIPTTYKFTAGDFADVVAFLEEHPGDFWLLGDATVLYGLTGRASVGSCLSMFPGLSMPMPGSPEFHALEAALFEEIRRRKVRYIVLEGKGTWFELRLKTFRDLHASLAAHPTRHVALGGFTIIEVPEALWLPPSRSPPTP